ncbi:hypothetical protein BHM03_00048466, partial [Ensete ventricosum]
MHGRQLNQTQIERHKNIILRQENDKLRAENLSIREATRNPVCNNCGGLAILGEGSLEEHHLRIENARLKDELDRVCSLIGKFLGKPISASSSPLPLPMSNSTLDLVVGSNVFTGLDLVTPATLPPVTDFTTGATSGAFGTITTPARNVGMGTLDGPVVLVSEATRATDAVIINSLALVETLMRATRWMHAELQVLSPLVPVRDVHFLRFCKQLTEGAWAVVDVSVDGIRDDLSAPPPNELPPVAVWLCLMVIL